MIRLFVLMATVAALTGTATPNDIWNYPPPAVTEVHSSDVAPSAEADVSEPVVAVRACLTVSFEDVGGSPKITDRVYDGVSPADLRADVVGHYLVYELAPPAGPGVDSIDRLLGSVDVTGLDEYTLCRGDE